VYRTENYLASASNKNRLTNKTKKNLIEKKAGKHQSKASTGMKKKNKLGDVWDKHLVQAYILKNTKINLKAA